MKKTFQYFLFTILVVFISSCKKDKRLSDVLDENVWITQTITKEGGTISVNNDLKLVFPKDALDEDEVVSVGYTGDEPLSVPNPAFEVLGRPFTIQIAVDSLKQDVLIEMSKPKGYTNPDEISIFISNGDSYFPLFWSETKDKIIARLDYLNFEKFNNQRVAENARLDLPETEFFVSILKSKQSLPTNEMGIKKIEIGNGGLLFSNLPVLKKTDKVLILVHGWISSPSNAWTTFVEKIYKKLLPSGYTHIVTFGYNSGLAIDDNGEKLASFLKTLTNGAEVDIIGHSMGGLVSRSAIENHGAAQFVKSLTTIGTPHQGASLASIRNAIGGVILVSSTKLVKAYNLLNFFNNSKGLRDLDVGSAFLTNLNKNPAPSSTSYYPIASVGNGGLGEGDGIVAQSSAMGIQANQPNVTIGKIFQINMLISHTAQTENDEIIQHIADRLNQINKNTFFNLDLLDGSVSDIEGNKYATIRIGSQTWMAENLKTTKYNDGSNIPNVTNNTSWSNLNSGAWVLYNNDISYSYLGNLYNWHAVNSGKLCPNGWHIPTDDDWTKLEQTLGLPSSETEVFGWRGEAQSIGSKLKSARGWETNDNSTNQSGFSALPGGYRLPNGSFMNISLNGLWWSSTENTADIAWARNLYHKNSSIDRGVDPKNHGYSCRCVKD
ncbi:MAG: hypothetical protein M9887_02020 [Chitinophagales bacterium]|nr:hypothetical protein [Chitinophagales bacterium]